MELQGYSGKTYANCSLEAELMDHTNAIRRYTTTYSSSSPCSRAKLTLASSGYNVDIAQLIANLKDPGSLLSLETVLGARQVC